MNANENAQRQAQLQGMRNAQLSTAMGTPGADRCSIQNQPKCADFPKCHCGYNQKLTG